MNKQFLTFKREMDSWVKDFNSQLSLQKDIFNLVGEQADNIDHNYELIQELRAETRQLKEELQALRMVQLLHLKSDVESIKKH